MLGVVVFAAPRSLALELDLLLVLVVPFLGRKVVKTFLELEIFTGPNQVRILIIRSSGDLIIKIVKEVKLFF